MSGDQDSTEGTFCCGSNLLQFRERVVSSCIAADLVGGEGFALDASLIEADAIRQRSIVPRNWHCQNLSKATISASTRLSSLDVAFADF
jgi:hypothetical protein